MAVGGGCDGDARLERLGGREGWGVYAWAWMGGGLSAWVLMGGWCERGVDGWVLSAWG